MARVLVFRSKWDTATLYGYAWLGEIARQAVALGHEVLDLEGDNATPENFMDAMNTFNPELVFAMGHGDPTRFSGQNGRIVLSACENDQVMVGRQAYFVSCLMGQSLAPSMVDKGARTVAAYIAEFTWMIHPDEYYRAHPLEDPYAYPFMRAVVEPSVHLLMGGSWREFYDLTVSLFNQGISEWFNSTDPYAPSIVAALKHDRDSLVVYGLTETRPAGIPFNWALIAAQLMFGAVIISSSGKIKLI